MTPEGVKSLASAKLIWMKIGRDSDTFWTAEVLVLRVVRAAEWVSSTKQLFCIEKPDTEPVQSWCWAGVGWYVQFYGLLSHFLLLRCLTPVNFLKGVGTMNVLISLVCSYFLTLFVTFIV